MRIGTKSLLAGAHQILIHPITITLAWRQLYGRWPTWRQAICIVIHDWGYWGCANMDGAEGNEHPRWAAEVAAWMFGNGFGDLCLLHSRHLARDLGREPSPLCWADKLGTAITPWWLYLPGAWWSGELDEYRQQADLYHRRTGKGCPAESTTARDWFRWMTRYMADVAKRGAAGRPRQCMREDN